jgi:hypothetical protein
MLVWVVEHGYEYEAGHPVAVFSSEEAARDWVRRMMNSGQQENVIFFPHLSLISM